MKGLGGDERVTVRLTALICVAVTLIALAGLPADAAGATALPSGYQETVVFSGLANPTVVRFSPDGRIFVAEKSGLIKVFDNLTDTTPTVFADLRTNVHNFWDRGLLGMALAPNFPTDPSVYVLYTYDAAIGGTAPRWGTVGRTSDGARPRREPRPTAASSAAGCPGCRRPATSMTGPEQVLIEDWCQQYPSHSVGSLAFGADGALYVSGGDGASFNFADYGQDGSPLNPCGDPPGGVGGALSPPAAEGGALRSQDVRTAADPTGLNGSILRIDPATGAGLPDNPLAFSPDPNARRIIAHGFRNPFRFTVRPGTSEVWVGDVGWSDWEEIDVVKSQPDAVADNFGWPCYEGTGRQSGYDAANLALCETLYAQPAESVAPVLHVQPCRRGRSRRGVPDWQLVHRRARLRDGLELPGERRRGAVLRRLLARLHLAHAHRQQRGPRSGDCVGLRRRGGQPGRPRLRAGRVALLLGFRRRHGPSDLLHRRRRYHTTGRFDRVTDARRIGVRIGHGFSIGKRQCRRFGGAIQS